MGGDKNCHGIELAHWQTSCIAGLKNLFDIFLAWSQCLAKSWLGRFAMQGKVSTTYARRLKHLNSEICLNIS